MAASSRVLFSPLPDGNSRLRSFGAGLGLEFIALTLLVVIPMLLPQRLEVVTKYWITPVAAPHIEAWKPQPAPKPTPRPEPVKQPVIVKVAKEIPPAPIVPPKPRIMTPVFTSPIAKRATAKKDVRPDDLVVKPVPVYADKAPTSLGSSAIPTLKRPREAVQTGGFGDPNGVPVNPSSHGSPNIATLGSYDLPPGPGQGNGTGGAKGARGVVASAGFGNGVATGGTGGNRSGGVQQGVFADESPAAAAPKVKPAANANPRNEPVEILFKPHPQYTEQARQKKIEGDVLLQVIFTASGQVQVEKVIRGLGYGLDETAQAAAHQIQFKPARQDGQPVDFSGIVHITFELAY